VAFERAGDGQWGGAVQDDYIEVVKWAIRDGVAAAGRVCFFGEGYGAFSALTAAAREPELFQCVIGISGIYDLPAMFGGGKEAVPPALQQVLGNDMEDLQARSPVSRAAAIKAKVWLIDQPTDDEVPADQMVRMRKALADAGNRPRAESIGQGQGMGQAQGGYFVTEARAAVYERLVQFVKENIGN
jgi:dipeptidyl aminopeptidase/acylaminoacyl peptidase